MQRPRGGRQARRRSPGGPGTEESRPGPWGLCTICILFKAAGPAGPHFHFPFLCLLHVLAEAFPGKTRTHVTPEPNAHLWKPASAKPPVSPNNANTPNTRKPRHGRPRDPSWLTCSRQAAVKDYRSELTVLILVQNIFKSCFLPQSTVPTSFLKRPPACRTISDPHSGPRPSWASPGSRPSEAAGLGQGSGSAGDGGLAREPSCCCTLGAQHLPAPPRRGSKEDWGVRRVAPSWLGPPRTHGWLPCLLLFITLGCNLHAGTFTLFRMGVFEKCIQLWKDHTRGRHHDQ